MCKSSDPTLSSVPAKSCCSGSCQVRLQSRGVLAVSEDKDYPIQADAANPSGDKFCRADNYPFEDQEAANTCKVRSLTRRVRAIYPAFMINGNKSEIYLIIKDK